jgi:hypothetical protein
MTIPDAIRGNALRKGDTGAIVRFWQLLLRDKGFVVDTDGVFGDKTLHATLVAQKWAGVEADGLVGPVTWQAVEEKERTKRPATTIGNISKTVLGQSPKIIDARDGRAGFAKHPTRTWERRTGAQILAKLGHYTGGPASFQSDAHFHVTSDYLTKGGAPAIAYTLGVDKDGTLFVFNDWQSITWHCDGGRNTATLGIVFRGAAEGPSAAQKATLRWLWKNLSGGTFQPIVGGAPWPKIVPSTTHRHVNATTCPGESGEAFYRQISGETFRTSV